MIRGFVWGFRIREAESNHNSSHHFQERPFMNNALSSLLVLQNLQIIAAITAGVLISKTQGTIPLCTVSQRYKRLRGMRANYEITQLPPSRRPKPTASS